MPSKHYRWCLINLCQKKNIKKVIKKEIRWVQLCAIWTFHHTIYYKLLNLLYCTILFCIIVIGRIWWRKRQYGTYIWYIWVMCNISSKLISNAIFFSIHNKFIVQDMVSFLSSIYIDVLICWVYGDPRVLAVRYPRPPLKIIYYDTLQQDMDTICISPTTLSCRVKVDLLVLYRLWQGR